MPRELNDPLFDLTELEVGADCSHRNAVMLGAANLLPAHVHGGGKGKARLWDMHGVSHMAIIGGFQKSGIDWFLAAKISCAIVHDIKGFQGYWNIPIGLDDFWRDAQPGEKSTPSLDEVVNEATCARDWQFHLWLMKNRQSYINNNGKKNDLRALIVDRSHILIGTGMRVAGDSKEPKGYTPIARIENWSRGATAEINTKGISGETSISDEIAREFSEAWRDSVGTFIVNISLSVRIALARITNIRKDTS